MERDSKTLEYFKVIHYIQRVNDLFNMLNEIEAQHDRIDFELNEIKKKIVRIKIMLLRLDKL